MSSTATLVYSALIFWNNWSTEGFGAKLESSEILGADWGNLHNAVYNYISEVVEDREIHKQVGTDKFVVVYTKEGTMTRYYDTHSSGGRFLKREAVDASNVDATMATCEGCNNDHGKVGVMMGHCPYEFN